MTDWPHPITADTTRLGPFTSLSGLCAGAGDLIIEGIFRGRVELPGHAVMLGPDADVDAEIFARDVTIMGRLRGKVTAVEVVDLRATATVHAYVAAPSFILADGARFDGRVETKRADAAVRVARYRMQQRSHP